MKLIIGGAYQGKLTYAREAYGLEDQEIYTCNQAEEADFSKRCVRRLEEYVLGCVRRGQEPKADFRPDAVIICRDVSCGVVPMEPELREWREATGRLVNRLAAQADSVTRLFCGLPQKLK